MFHCTYPSFDPAFSKQTAPSDISDDDFQRGIEPPKATTKDRVWQVIQFIFGFGWLRYVLVLLFVLLDMVSLVPLYVVYKLTGRTFFLEKPSEAITRLYLRIVIFFLGIYHVKINGKFSDEARVIVFNHTTLIDGPLVYIYKPFSVISAASVKNVPFFGYCLNAIRPLWIDRAVKAGNSDIIMKRVLEKDMPPVGLAPEGKTSHGYYMMKFRTGGFRTDEPIQPVVIRYHTLFARGKSSFQWSVGGFREWFWRCLSVPIGFAEIDCLPVIEKKDLEGKSPNERALICQLEMANKLGVKAITRSSVEIFQKKKND